MYIKEEAFEEYAKLILHLVAVEENDLVMISADFDHKYLVAQLTRHAYKLGAKYVYTRIQSEYLDGIRAEFSNESFLEFFPESIVNSYKEFNDNKACIISIRSPEAPHVNKNVPAENLTKVSSTRRNKLNFFHDSIITDRLSWIVASCPTVGWANTVFPKLQDKEAEEKLWEVLKKILRLNTPNPVEAWTKQQNKILRRRTYMNEKKYKGIKLVTEGTNLSVHLNERSKWLGAAHTSVNGKYFQANLPTEEVYTSPDCRCAEGKVKVKRALPILGKMASGITLEFSEGKVVSAHAEEGNDVLQKFLDANERNRYLGEIALVDIKSPIWESGLLFNSILYDENAGVHFALGSAYTSGYGFAAGEKVGDKELIDIGCNASPFHLDFVIGDDHINVYGITHDNSEEAIIENGLFIPELQ